jgi:hypothetical protein
MVPETQQERTRGLLRAAVARAVALAEGKRQEAGGAQGPQGQGEGEGYRAHAKAERGGVWPERDPNSHHLVIVILEL